MSIIDPVSSGTALYGASESSSVQTTSDMFLKLLMTEIQYQDPMDPMDNQAFIDQLAQLSALEEMQAMNENLEEQMVFSQSINNTTMLGLVGKTATVPGESIVVADGEASGNKIYSAANGVATISVLDENGEVVDTYTLPVDAGWTDVDWDGKTSLGEDAADGEYTLSVKVQDQAGNDVDHYTYMNRTVESIRFENNLALISIGGSDFYAAEVVEVGL